MTVRASRAGVAALMLLALSLLARPAAAAPADVANDIAQNIMSPFCPGLTLHDCPSGTAIELRDQIQKWAAAGWSRERILDELEDQYGSAIRATPPTEGAGLLAWVLPGLALAGGATAAWWLARRWRSRSVGLVGAAPSPLSAEDRARLDAELARLRSQA